MVDSGGRVAGDDAAADPAPKPNEIVPLTYWSNCPKLYQELDHAVSSLGWVDLTCCDDNLAMLCIRAQKPYLGFCMSDKHLDLLLDRLEKMVFECFQTVGDSLFEQGLVTLLKPANADTGEQQTGGQTAGKEATDPKPAEQGSTGGSGPQPAPASGSKGGRGGALPSPGSKEKLLSTLRKLELGVSGD